MNRAIVFIVVFLSVTLLLCTPSCAMIKEAVQSMKPEIRGITLEWREVTSQITEVIATIKVYNPNPISLPIKKVTCSITMADVKMGSAETKDLHIRKNAESPVKISAQIDNTKIPDFWAEHLRRNEKSEALIDVSITFDLVITDFTYPFQLKQSIETDLLAGLKKVGPILVEEKGKLPITGQEKAILKITLESLSGKWGTITSDSTEVNLLATVHNENPYPLAIPKIAYQVDMNEIVLASGESEVNYYFAPNSKNNISTIITLETGLMDKWFVSHIRQGEKSTFNIQVSLVFELPEEVAQQLGQEKVIVPIWEGTKEFETSILGTKR